MEKAKSLNLIIYERITFMNTEKIGYVEAIALISIVMINKIILNTPKDIIANTRPIIMAKRNLYLNYCNWSCMVCNTSFKKISWI